MPMTIRVWSGAHRLHSSLEIQTMSVKLHSEAREKKGADLDDQESEL